MNILPGGLRFGGNQQNPAEGLRGLAKIRALRGNYTPEGLRAKLEGMLDIIEKPEKDAELFEGGLTNRTNSHAPEREVLNLYVRIVDVLLQKKPLRDLSEISGIIEKAESLSKKLDQQV